MMITTENQTEKLRITKDNKQHRKPALKPCTYTTHRVFPYIN